MKDDIRNLKEITDLVLKDVYVTDELKSKTLELCKKEKSNILKPFLAAASSAAIIAISLTGYQYFSHKTDNSLNTKQIAQNINNINSDNPKNSTGSFPNNNSSSKIDEKPKPETPYKNTKDKNSSNSNSTTSSHNGFTSDTLESNKIYIDSSKAIPKNDDVVSSTKSDIVQNDMVQTNKAPETQASTNSSTNKVTNSSPMLKDSSVEKNSASIVASLPSPSITTLADTLSTAEAEKYWGSKLSLPAYIPNNFELTDISIPKDNKEIYVKFTYSSKNSYFKITQNKSTKYNITGKSVDINGINAAITQNKDETNSSTIITQIIWVKDNIQYSVIGNISDVELINIAKSIS